MLEYKIITYNPKALTVLWNDNWQLCSIYENMMFFSREVKKKRESKELELSWFEAWYKFDLLQKIHIMVTHRLKVLQFNDSSGRSVLCKTAEQLLEFLFNMETWKDIPWYEWKYQVSNIWNINSLSFNKTKVCKSLNI